MDTKQNAAEIRKSSGKKKKKKKKKKRKKKKKKIMKFFDVREEPGLGRCAFAVRDYERGDRIAVERACLVWPVAAEDGDSGSGTEPMPTAADRSRADTVALLKAFASCEGGDAARTEILAHFCTPPLETEADLARLSDLHAECVDAIAAHGDAALRGVSLSDAFRVALVAVSNGFSVPGTGFGALFRRVAMFAHSCAPNVTYTSVDEREEAACFAGDGSGDDDNDDDNDDDDDDDDDDNDAQVADRGGEFRPVRDALLFRATRRIARGEMLSITYISDETLCRSTAERRRILWRSKSFLCGCPRCRRPDMMRALKCPDCGAPALPVDSGAGAGAGAGIVEVASHHSSGTPSIPSSLDADSTTEQWICTERCSGGGCINFTRLPLQEEAAIVGKFEALRTEWRSTGGMTDPREAPRRVGIALRLMNEAAGRLSPSHWVAGMIPRLVVELLIAASVGAGIFDGDGRGMFLSTILSMVVAHRRWLTMTGVTREVPIAAAGFATIAGEVHRRAGNVAEAVTELETALPHLMLASSAFHPSVRRAREFVLEHGGRVDACSVAPNNSTSVKGPDLQDDGGGPRQTTQDVDTNHSISINDGSTKNSKNTGNKSNKKKKKSRRKR
jgi:hypothetical protein